MTDDIELEDAIGLVMHFQTVDEGVVPAMKDPVIVTTYHCWMAIGQDGPSIYERKYVDRESVEAGDARYSMRYDAEVEDMEEAKYLFKDSVADWMRRLFK